MKVESLQPSGSYKYRGAINKITSLIEQYGHNIQIITASSGNHGMACALAAHDLGISVTVVVPEPTPQIKKDCIRTLGANLLEIGATYDYSYEAACKIADEKQLFYVHPVADRYTVGGQGTISLEIIEQLPAVQKVISTNRRGRPDYRYLLCHETFEAFCQDYRYNAGGLGSLRRIKKTG